MLAKIASTYHAWRGQSDAIEQGGAYKDISGFCYSASLEDIKTHGYVLTPGRYVGAEDELDDSIPFEEKFKVLKDKLEVQFDNGHKIEKSIDIKLRSLNSK